MSRRAVAVLALVLCSPALAQEEEDALPVQEVGPAREHGWSAGVGVGFGVLVGGTPGLGVPGLGGLPGGAPGLSASLMLSEAALERRVSDEVSLVLSVNAAYTTNSVLPETPPPSGQVTFVRYDSRTSVLQGAVGVRRWLTGVSSPVLLSVALLGGVGRSDSSSVTTSLTEDGVATPRPYRASSTSVSLRGSVAAERLLAESLSVRLGLQVLQLGYAFGKGAAYLPSEQDIRTEGFFAGVSLSPSLELRMYF